MPFGTTPLNDGNKIPQIAFGTGTSLGGKDATSYVEQALENGFSHIDTAQVYHNEESVGTAIRESGLKREDLFITTKYWSGDIRTTLQASLKKLGVTYVDLYLIHQPYLVKDIGAAWKQFEKLKADGLAKSIGVSNFSVQDLTTLLKTAKVVPAVNQIRFHPYNYKENVAMLKFAAQHGIVIEGYSPLTPITKNPGGPVDKPVNDAAKRLGATPAQVLLLWVKTKGVVIVTQSTKKERLQQYLQVADLGAGPSYFAKHSALLIRECGNEGSLTAQEVSDIDKAGAKGPSLLLQNVKRRLIPMAMLAFVGLAVHTFMSRV